MQAEMRNRKAENAVYISEEHSQHIYVTYLTMPIFMIES